MHIALALRRRSPACLQKSPTEALLGARWRWPIVESLAQIGLHAIACPHGLPWETLERVSDVQREKDPGKHDASLAALAIRLGKDLTSRSVICSRTDARIA